MSSLSDLSPLHLWSKNTLAPRCLGKTLRGTLESDPQALFFPLQTSIWERTSASKLCAAGTPGRVLKRQCGESWWVMQSNQSGECSLLCVSGLFVCWALFHSFSPVYLSMANAVVSTEVCSSLCNIPLLSIWYVNHLASPKYWSALRQDWNGSLSMKVRISEAHPYSHSNGCFIFLVRELWDSDEGNAVSEQTKMLESKTS